AVFGDDGQVLAVDQHLFLVGACGDQDRVAVTRRVDRLLDGGETARADQQHPAAVAVFDDLDVDEGVDAVARNDRPVAPVGDEAGAGADHGGIDAAVAVKRVVAGPAGQPVVAGAGDQRVVAAAAVDLDRTVGGVARGVSLGVVRADDRQRLLRSVVDLADRGVGDRHALGYDAGGAGVVDAGLTEPNARRGAVDRAVVDRDAVERRGRARVAAVVARPDDDRRAEVERGVGRRPVVDAGAAADVGEV